MKKMPFMLEIVVFLCGGIIMVFEIVGARVLGPYFGTSTFVWTSIIGIILASLSIGYYLGGKIADRKPHLSVLSRVVFVSGVLLAFMFFIKEPFLSYLSKSVDDVKMGSVLATIVLFAPASIFLGMVSPYAVKLKMDSLKTSGSVVGSLYSLSTVGSIIGTFLAGFYFIPNFGTNIILIFLCGLLFFLSLFIYSGKAIFVKFPVIFLILLVLINVDFSVAGRIDIDTTYNRVWIYDHEYRDTGRVVKRMGINNENHSSMFLDSQELVNEYTKYYHLVRFFKPDFNKVLMLGGAAYSYPKDYLIQYPEAFIDVVEIDPMMTELAMKYFGLKEDPRLRIFHQDGRVFLNKTKDKYDAIMGDAFSSRYSVPYQLTTLEAVQRKYDILSDDGIVILNVISSIEGEKGRFLRAEYATYKAVFPKVLLFQVFPHTSPDVLQNLIIVALKNDSLPNFQTADSYLRPFLRNIWEKEVVLDMPVLTDDYAPVEYYIHKAF